MRNLLLALLLLLGSSTATADSTHTVITTGGAVTLSVVDIAANHWKNDGRILLFVANAYGASIDVTCLGVGGSTGDRVLTIEDGHFGVMPPFDTFRYNDPLTFFVECNFTQTIGGAPLTDTGGGYNDTVGMVVVNIWGDVQS